MNRKKDKDEYLEKMWYMKEENKESLDDLREMMGESFDQGAMESLVADHMIEFDKIVNKVSYTKEGEAAGKQLIRAHRIAERMIHDVMGGDFERGACEFEHTVTPELVDGICTLLGHPKECPHGLPIPSGNCCVKMSHTAESSVCSLTDMKVGGTARVAYVSTKNDQQLHKIDGLQIRPGAIVKLHQVYPTYVVECEGVNIALDQDVTSNISVWKDPKENSRAEEALDKNRRKSRFRRGLRIMLGGEK